MEVGNAKVRDTEHNCAREGDEARCQEAEEDEEEEDKAPAWLLAKPVVNFDHIEPDTSQTIAINFVVGQPTVAMRPVELDNVPDFVRFLVQGALGKLAKALPGSGASSTSAELPDGVDAGEDIRRTHQISFVVQKMSAADVQAVQVGKQRTHFVMSQMGQVTPVNSEEETTSSPSSSLSFLTNVFNPPADSSLATTPALSTRPLDPSALPFSKFLSGDPWLAGCGHACRRVPDAPERWAALAAGALFNRSCSTSHGKEAQWSARAAEVREAFLHAWRGYRRYAWGADELRPVSKQGRNSFGEVGLSVLDALDTLWLLGLPDEFDEAEAFVERGLALGVEDTYVSVFELTIRALGGLLGAHSLSGRPVFLSRARELAERLLPAFNTSSGLPLRSWNLRRRVGDESPQASMLADAGSLQLEWRYLSEQTGDPRFGKVADAAFEAILVSGARGIMPVRLTPPTHSRPRFVKSKFSLGGMADSYYEYLLKQWLQKQDRVLLKNMFLEAMEELKVLVRPAPTTVRQLYKIIEFEPSGKASWKMEHLSCFVPGMIALGLLTLPQRDVEPHWAQWSALAEGITASCVEMWTSTVSGLAPEHIHVSAVPPHNETSVPMDGKHSLLRPETVESLYYMYRLTSDEKYRQWGEQLFRAILAESKTEAGFSSVDDVRTMSSSKRDEMHSFVLAETFKYLYLLFSPPGLLDLSKYVLNTEGHPLRTYPRDPEA